MNATKQLAIHLSGRLRRSPFVLNVANLFVGDVLVQAIGFLSLLLLTRLYSPEAFGILGVFMAISEVGAKLSTLRYDAALVLPDNNEPAGALFRFSMYTCVAFCALLLIIGFLGSGLVSALVDLNLTPVFFLLIALMVMGLGADGLCVFWWMRGKHFRSIAESSVIAATIGNGTKILGGLSGYGAGGLLLGTVLQRWVRIGLLWRSLVAPERPKLMGTLRDSLQQARTYRDFPYYRMPQEVIHMFAQQAPTVLLAAFYGATTAGFYILATRILQLPVAMMQTSFRRVFYVRSVEAQRCRDSLFHLCMKYSTYICLGLLPVALVVIFWAGPLFVTVCGSEWTTSGTYAKWVMVFLLFGSISVPFSAIMPVVGLNRFYLIYEIISVTIRLSVISFVAASATAIATVIAISLGATLSSLIFTTIVLLYLRHRDLSIANDPHD